ncbi:polysaccharide deacetylase family protein [Rossellomorea vietnamensis]|uniref:Polysaccharide deacetylase family protein n=1 Tax=Rossellomorea vietnamensis TaxID=218284 RepID=A0A5D4KFJ8_9BACI|nr:polysaccharide deacetylase family protein [Rossellomorea vietnamensis]TYR75982.1 polysaccharide deacetylase family protein [Rossellomorea vietnamensis]
MKNTFGKTAFAVGFFTLLSIIAVGFSLTIEEYSLLAEEHDGVFPAVEKAEMEACVRGSEMEVREFAFDGDEADSIPILTYHRILSQEDMEKAHYIDGEVNSMIVFTEEFAKHMKYLHDNGYETLTLKELYAFLNGEIDVPDKSVVLTFDDGFKDNYEEAYPIMKKYGFKAANFIVTGAITNKRYSFSPKLSQYLSKKEMEKSCDVFDYQSHTYNYHKRDENKPVDEWGNHPSYLVAKSQDDIYNDLKTSIHNLNGENLAFAYPYGEYSPDTISVLKELGFKMAFTVVDEAATRDHHLYEIPRYQIYHDVDLETFKYYVEQ